MVEIYLKLPEWGEGVFGAEAAARRYFGKGTRDLTRREAALLATALPNPILRNPARPSRRHQALAQRLVGRMEGAAPFADCLTLTVGHRTAWRRLRLTSGCRMLLARGVEHRSGCVCVQGGDPEPHDEIRPSGAPERSRHETGGDDRYVGKASFRAERNAAFVRL